MEPNTHMKVTAGHKGPVNRDEVLLRLLPFLHPFQLLSTHCFNTQVSETPDLRPEESSLGQGCIWVKCTVWIYTQVTRLASALVMTTRNYN